MVEVEAAEVEMARDTMRMALTVTGAPTEARLRLELPAYAYYRLGLDTRSRFRVQLKPEWLHLMATG